MTTADTVPDTVPDPVLPALLEPGRAEAIEASGLLTPDGDPMLDRLARLASALVGAPRAFVTLVTPERQHFPGMVRHDQPATSVRDEPLSMSLCQFALTMDEPLVIPDSRHDPLVRGTAPVRSGQIGAYAGVPLRTSDGHVLGTLCVSDPQPREWDPRGLRLLEELTALAAHEVQQRLDLSRDRRAHQLAEQVAQRVPPLADALESLAGIAEQQDDPRLQRYAALTRSRMEPVAALARQLRDTYGQGSVAAAGPRDPVDLRGPVQSAVRSARSATGTDAIRVDAGPIALPVRCDVLGVERAVAHLLVTALHHARGDSPIAVRLSRSEPTTDGSTDEKPEAEFVLEAEDSPVPTGELARIVSRFEEVICEQPVPGDAHRPAAIRITGGTVRAESGSVRGRVSRDGRLALSARWLVDTEANFVSG